MTELFDHEFVRKLLDDGSGQLDRWLGWLQQNGFGPPDQPMDELRIVALAAGIRFSKAGRPKAKVKRFVRRLLSDNPGGDVDWVAVDWPGTKDIELEPGPFSMGIARPRTRIPFVFDPQPIYKVLQEAPS